MCTKMFCIRWLKYNIIICFMFSFVLISHYLLWGACTVMVDALPRLHSSPCDLVFFLGSLLVWAQACTQSISSFWLFHLPQPHEVGFVKFSSPTRDDPVNPNNVAKHWYLICDVTSQLGGLPLTTLTIIITIVF